MENQPVFPALYNSLGRKKTAKQRFLEQMNGAVPWDKITAVIAPFYYQPSAQGGRPPIPLRTILSLYFVQNWYSLSDRQAEDMLNDTPCVSEFCGVEFCSGTVPDHSTLAKFRHLLEKHDLTQAIFEVVNDNLMENGVKLSTGEIIDATILPAPTSTKNADHARDPEMAGGCKNGNPHFGAKAHISVDAENGMVRNVAVTPGNVHDIKAVDEVLDGDEEYVIGDKAYVSAKRKEEFAEEGKEWRVPHKKPPKGKLTPEEKQHNRDIGKIRAKVEFPFRIIKCQFGFKKIRYRGLKKNRVQLFTLFALGNIYQFRRRLLNQQMQCA